MSEPEISEEKIARLKLPIKVIVNHLIKTPMLMINPEHYQKLMDIMLDPELEYESWRFRKVLEGMIRE